MMDRKRSGGMGVLGVLGIVFIVLKLTGLIDWPWVWVLSPYWITAALAIILVILTILADDR